MAGSPSKPWFAAKRYGYGAGLPIAWQGWVVMLAMIVAIVACASLLPAPARFFVPLVVAMAFIPLCAFKTKGGWRWRWGDRR